MRALIQRDELVGYEHVTDMHAADNEWIGDLVSKPRQVKVSGRTIRLRTGVSAWDAFDRDCCLLLDNVFFAQGEGIQIDQRAVNVLKAAQPGVKGIDEYAVFGVDTTGQANGMRGRYLEISGGLADRFVDWLTDWACRVTATRAFNEVNPSKVRCRPRNRHRRKPEIC